MRKTWILLIFGAALILAVPAGVVSRNQATAPRAGAHGAAVAWEGWTFTWAVRDREGLVITDVSYRGRKVLKYAGLAEIFTIYDQGDPRPIDFDQGITRMEVLGGIDCSSNESCKLFDIHGNAPTKGSPAQVMLHEEKTGPNYLGGFGRAPGKQLVLWMPVRFTGGADGYTFVIRWKFRDDGTLIPEIGATGVPQHLKTGGVSSPTGAVIGINKTGGSVGPIANGQKVFAPSHVHSFLYRLDFDIDGENNVVEEFNWERVKDADLGPSQAPQARCTWTPLVKEQGRPLNQETFRSWRVVNRTSKNALGQPRSYQLIPGNTGVFRSDARFNSGAEAAAQADLWVTRFHPNEFGGMDALGKKYANDEDVEDRNIVLWHWLSFHHYPRSEDWLHQPMVWGSFQLMPRDFLDESPLKPD